VNSAAIKGVDSLIRSLLGIRLADVQREASQADQHGKHEGNQDDALTGVLAPEQSRAHAVLLKR
jgi:hypothetical protein